MPKTIRELADEFGVSKQAIRKKLDASFRENYVQTVTRNGVQTLVVVNSGYLLLKQHFGGSNNQKPEGVTFTSNLGNSNQNTIELLNQQLAIKDSQIKEKDEQLKSMQKLLNQSQQLQLMAENKIKKLENTVSDEQTDNDSSDKPVQTSNVNTSTMKSERGFWSRIFSTKSR
ncbi:hypothetical protein BSQ39_12790 [Loigolactobacillus backii]|uniref:hypothetical protein n=1 Tax=Loigolactobacillus backii TaxID=375175 RepID=UPI0007F135CF|nr:hypothetical protein [Loigolactobacillus backii]ANK61174.1 hypothetical protein AYR52_12535 [Loigolactobacillus backii]OLF69049.1 hypothetical protein ACX53_10010 [Loigolactobacillus backii]PIO80025.1 hypothetical protein BSQ39_12790 [Loigolactobacillus backii]PIO88530.1 hypothetical protein B8A32_00570 [Loigolactobacillus backii]